MSSYNVEIWEDVGDQALSDRQVTVLEYLHDEGLRGVAAFIRWHWTRGKEVDVGMCSLPRQIRSEYEWGNDEAAGRTFRTYVGMENRRMQTLLNAGECIDVGQFPWREDIGKNGAFELQDLTVQGVQGMELCEVESEQWIRAVGVRTETGQLYASYEADFHEIDGFECVWLR